MTFDEAKAALEKALPEAVVTFERSEPRFDTGETIVKVAMQGKYVKFAALDGEVAPGMLSSVYQCIRPDRPAIDAEIAAISAEMSAPRDDIPKLPLRPDLHARLDALLDRASAPPHFAAL